MYLFKQTKLNRINLNFSVMIVALLMSASCSKGGDPDVIAKMDPYLIIDGTTNVIEDADGVNRKVALKVNGTWEVVVPAGIDWVDVSPKTGKDNGTVNVTIHENLTYDSRIANLSFRVNDELHEGVSFQISQRGKERQVTYETILEENFDWLKSGSLFTVGLPILYDTADELRIDRWPSSFKAHGWESGGTNRIYAREGLIKMGASGESDFLVSPPLEFEGTKNLKIEFKAVPYITSANNRDNGQIKVGVTQEGVIVMPSEFSLDNWFDMASDPQTIAIWSDPGSLYSFEIKGATSGIRIKIGSEGNRQRFFLDDIIIKAEND